MTDDLWGIADDVDALAEWDPAAAELASVPDRADWVRRRFLALRFVTADHAETAAAYDAELSRLTNARDVALRRLETQIGSLTDQLEAYHRAVIREEESAWLRRAEAALERGEPVPKKVVTSTMANPHGKLRSGGGRARVRVVDKDAAVAWLRVHAPDAVRHQPETWEPDLSKLPGHVTFNDLGDPLGVIVVTEDGERLFAPGLAVDPPVRWHKVDPA